MKCVIYARVSTKREEQKNSLENQVSLAERMAKEHGFTIVGRYIDNSISGTGFKNRLEINRLLVDAKSKKFDVVIAKSELYKKRRRVEPENQVIIENAHSPLISEEDFQAVQELMKSKGKYKSNGKESLFAHIAQCADCKSGMHFKPDRRNGAYVCGGYVKHTISYCSSHIIEESLLLNAVKADIKALIKDTVKVEKLYGIAEKKASSLQSFLTKELKQIDRNIDKLNNQVGSLLTLHADGAMTTEMFKQQSERISIQLQELANRKVDLQSALATKKDNSEQLQAFKKEVERFSKLDIKDDNVLKQVLQRLINKIEVFEEGKIKIHYNLSPSLPLI